MNAEWEQRTFIKPIIVSALRHLRSRASGVGIPDDPTDENMRRILLEHLCVNSRIPWQTGQTLTSLATAKITWADGYNVYLYDSPRV